MRGVSRQEMEAGCCRICRMVERKIIFAWSVLRLRCSLYFSSGVALDECGSYDFSSDGCATRGNRGDSVPGTEEQQACASSGVRVFFSGPGDGPCDVASIRSGIGRAAV